MKYLFLLTALSLTCCSKTPTREQKAPDERLPPLTNFCDLVATPDYFIGKTVRIRAALRFPRHIVDLYSTRCNDPKNTTIDFVSAGAPDKDVGPCKSAGEIQTIEPKLMGEGTYGVDVQGKLEAAPDPPFINPFRYKFKADCLFERKIISSDHAHGPWGLPPDIRQKVEAFEAEN